MSTIGHKLVTVVAGVVLFGLVAGCSQGGSQSGGGDSVKIAFLHHSTGYVVWMGTTSKVSSKLFGKSAVGSRIADHNKNNGTDYQIEQMNFPTTSEGYPWANYPFDYYNLWVKHAGDTPFQGEPTLKMLTKQYDVIVWKHCFPVGNIQPDTGSPDIDSDEKRLENYKLQYAALKDKMHEFSDTTFVVWTGAALTEAATTPDEAQRTREFFDWVKADWDEPGDNIFLWDFYEIQTEGGPYLKPEYASGPSDSHPTGALGDKAAGLFVQRLVDVLGGKGDSTPLTGEAQ